MKPVRTVDSNMVYAGPTSEIADLHCERIGPGQIKSIWWFTPAEREAIEQGANLQLVIFGEPIQPVALAITTEEGVGEDAPMVLTRLETLRAHHGEVDAN